MKNKLYASVLSLALFCMPEFASAQAQVTNNQKSDNQNNSSQTKKEGVPNYTLEEDRSFAHWSIGVGAGVSVFDGDLNESTKRILPNAEAGYTLNANIERSFNPIFGLGIEYTFIPYKANEEGTNYKVKGSAHEGNIYLSVNMLNLFYRYRPQKWGLFLNTGIGISYYNAKMTDRTTGEVVVYNGHSMDLEDGTALIFPVAMVLEYNLSKYFALGLKGEYRLHNKDNFEGHTVNIRQGNWNDAFELLFLTFRYKPHFGKEYHVRNISYGDLNMKEINRRLADMEDIIRNMSNADSCCMVNSEKINQLAVVMNSKADTGFVVRKIAAATPEACPVPKVDERTKRVFNEALRGIQFETAKNDIKLISYPILDNIVAVMNENPKYELDIIGHTDNVGDAKYNLDLSDRRVHAVRMYLINKGIENTRLTSFGKGESEPVATNSTAEGRALNRRVEFVVKQGNQVLFKSE